MTLTQKYVNDIAFRAVGCAITVHKELGPGLLESIYEECFVYECRANGLFVEQQKELLINYKGIVLDKRFRLDVVIENVVIVELKATEGIIPFYMAKLLSQMKIAKIPKGLLINFNSINLVKEGLVPLVNDYFGELPAD